MKIETCGPNGWVVVPEKFKEKSGDYISYFYDVIWGNIPGVTTKRIKGDDVLVEYPSFDQWKDWKIRCEREKRL